MTTDFILGALITIIVFPIVRDSFLSQKKENEELKETIVEFVSSLSTDDFLRNSGKYQSSKQYQSLYKKYLEGKLHFPDKGWRDKVIYRLVEMHFVYQNMLEGTFVESTKWYRRLDELIEAIFTDLKEASRLFW